FRMTRYDIVVYGATGFTGIVIVRMLATEPLFKGQSIAVAGRSEKKLRTVLEQIANETGYSEVYKYPIIVADNENDESLEKMAKQAKVIMNAVGPYTLYGEAVVRAAVNNGASHVDLSAELSFLEGMEKTYGKQARENGSYIVGACGLASIPADLGVEYLKQNFDGTLDYVETCFRLNRGPSGYSFNTATCESVLLGTKSMSEGGEGALHRSLMPKPVPVSKFRPSFRFPLSKMSNNTIDAWTMPFLGTDQPTVERSQYYDYHENGKRPVQIYPYFTIGSFLNSIALGLWVAVFGLFALFGPTRRFVAGHAEELSFGMFKKSGPSPQQMKESSFDYFLFGTGWGKGESTDDKPTKKASVLCHGPDPGYTGATACLCASALALLDDREKLPKDGGVFTTATAFRNTRIFEYMRKMGVTFDLLPCEW
ncbi:hypothetical protein PRIPAC_77744, partial [Pristionchus pacificus]